MPLALSVIGCSGVLSLQYNGRCCSNQAESASAGENAPAGRLAGPACSRSGIRVMKEHVKNCLSDISYIIFMICPNVHAAGKKRQIIRQLGAKIPYYAFQSFFYPKFQYLASLFILDTYWSCFIVVT
jgi:hypothetical protein